MAQRAKSYQLGGAPEGAGAPPPVRRPTTDRAEPQRGLADLARAQPIRGRSLPTSLSPTPSLPGRAAMQRLLEALRRHGAAEVPGASRINPAKALEILHDGTVHGRSITAKQRGYFGLIASHHRPTRMKD